MIYEVLEAWGSEGLQTHVKKMQTEYKKRAAIVQEAAGKVYSSCCHLDDGWGDWLVMMC